MTSAPALSPRLAASFMGRTCDDLAAHLGGKIIDASGPITSRRLASRIAAIRSKRAWGAEVHVLTTTGEWVTFLRLPQAVSPTELLVVGLTASQADRIWCFGLAAATSHPKND